MANLAKFLLMFSLVLSSRALAADTLVNVDSDFDSSKQETLVGERFYRVMAKLSVFALYCDPKNELGYNQIFSRMWNGNAGLQARAEQAFGGEKKAYNHFEKMRNIEMNRLVFKSGRTGCQDTYPSFVKYIQLSPSQLTDRLQNAPRGSL